LIETITLVECKAAECVQAALCLVGGGLAPCWSWADQRELWSGKHGTTGHNFQVITDVRGNVIAISGPYEWFQFAAVLQSTRHLIGDCAAMPHADDPASAT
jgi:hypothetical protein